MGRRSCSRGRFWLPWSPSFPRRRASGPHRPARPAPAWRCAPATPPPSQRREASGAPSTAASREASRRPALPAGLRAPSSRPIARTASDSWRGCAAAYQRAADGTLIFASSIDALRGHPGGRFELSAQAIFDFLHLSVIPAPQSIFRDVSKLLAAEYLLLEDGRLSTGRYWEPPSEKQGRNVDELCAETVECLRGAVRHHGVHHGRFPAALAHPGIERQRAIRRGDRPRP